MLPDTIVLEVKAKHLNAAIFCAPCKCALAIAAKEQFNTSNVKEFVNNIIINLEEFQHETYTHGDFTEDLSIANRDDVTSEDIIRRITLRKGEKKTWKP